MDMTSETTYQALVREHPDLLAIIEDLDLVNPSTGRKFGVSEADERRREALVSVARRTLTQGRIYTSEQVISLLSTRLGIARERAVRGFEMMVSSGVLTTGSGIKLAL